MLWVNSLASDITYAEFSNTRVNLLLHGYGLILHRLQLRMQPIDVVPPTPAAVCLLSRFIVCRQPNITTVKLKLFTVQR